jgi:SAM-dependent methyltransferase
MELFHMDCLANQAYLRTDQYKGTQKLEARARLHQLFSTNPYGWQRWVFDHLNLQPNQSCLEVGCGPGWLWRENTARIPGRLQLTLADLSVGMMQAARAGNQNVEALYGVADVQALPFESAGFDRVIANHMLYHVPDMTLAAHELRRVLKPGGMLCAATNGLRNMLELDQLIHAVVPEWRAESENNASRFGLESAPGILGTAFKRVEVIEYTDSLWVTQAEPMVAYIQSLWGFANWNDDLAAEYQRRVQYEIDQQGGYRIQKSGGVVLAYVD